ncbi:hypothetical protein AKJ41_02855 [candidate division MSBL1 archaeon SCGC-AAA259O05]|uniref:Core-binding (CB) domain-containing protein n=1 Tax=candidate division MSBL1 archaeon SCGC-AAA259O05 TaxID=1698271 RepID=A0A133V3R2_9EURY|nr:hypothetical protein AKJ41_02855 [candidate division MSBL1 archaeon SCGC-AAA259O05]
MPSQDYEKKLEKLRKRISENSNLSPENEGLLQKFSRDMKLENYSAGRNHKLTTHIKRIAENVDVKLEEAGKQEVKEMVEWIHDQGFSPETERDYKVALRVFFKWLRNGDFGSKNCPKEVSWISTSLKKRDQKLPNNLLMEDDVRKLIENAKNSRCKALISMLWETGARMGEFSTYASSF